MSQKTQAQAVAEHIIPIVDRNPAEGSGNKQADLTSVEFLRQIRDGEQVVIDADEYEQFKAWRDAEPED